MRPFIVSEHSFTHVNMNAHAELKRHAPYTFTCHACLCWARSFILSQLVLGVIDTPLYIIKNVLQAFMPCEVIGQEWTLSKEVLH